MRRIFFTAATILSLLRVHAQQQHQETGYESRKLKVDEINLVSSYYSQSGNNAAVTGGIGSQHLTDIANVFDVRLFKYDKKQRKHTFDIEVGIDHYTSASSDKIDLKANSSASHADTRIYPSLTWSVENEKKGSTFGIGVSSSTEFDYQSFGANISFAQKTRNRNGEFSAKLQTYLDRVKLITPVELRNTPYGEEDDHYATTNRNTYAGSLSYSQIINQRFEVTLLADLVSQHGYLGLPFYRVYFADGSVHQENLPDNRLKIPLGVRANYFIGDRFIIRAYYRFYTDDWGLTSHTANIELPVKITPFFSVSPFYRYYTQSAVKYFAPYQQHTAKDNYYTSNYDLSKFNSSFFGAGVRIAPPKGILGMHHFNMLELRYGHYVKNINMNANIVSLNLRFK
ncbi:DUF3570 domain-containing protein [Chitinophaga pinensis]|uniref:DUF3570 domain-containing protein n=1 Tax=Chitinophaga pinensis (strain ATCC 43595 / DSM 2588 / LMG 13176 / NBRC 15968 / NCIMB 11800 / UQM 2034) TaxID=485918 RepID=A0A979GYI2_CHIPD|nr:DUF3570 domain-containing protein [Chitinophaga pinensis]ACU63184.1 hypothetical protein Cpin_5763 [Chitinophaga pinensis DSM 2588]